MTPLNSFSYFAVLFCDCALVWPKNSKSWKCMAPQGYPCYTSHKR